MTHTAYLGLGANLGDRLDALRRAVGGIRAAEGVEALRCSAVYETAPVGGPPQPDYLNAVVAFETTRSARSLLELARALEAEAGRVRAERWGPRALDVDVLLVGDEQLREPDLEVPHPRMWERAFVLAPLADVAPELVEVPSGGWPGVRRTELALDV